MIRRVAGRGDAVLVGLVLLVAGATALSLAIIRTPSLDERARAVESEIRCPVCQGLSIADSPAVTAQQMRDVVRSQLEAGATDDAIRAYFTARYGQWILLVPDARGGIVLWLLPAVAIGLGLAVIASRSRAGPLRPSTAAPGGSMSGGPAAGGAAPKRRRQGASLAAPGPFSSGVAVLAVLAAVGLPLAVAVGPRILGGTITGGPPGIQAGPSIDQLRAQAAANPKDIATLVALGDAYMLADQSSLGIAAYEQALAVDPSYTPALLQLGIVLLSAGQPGAAGPVFDRILARNPDQPDALLYRGLARYQVDGRLSGAARSDLMRFLAVASADPRRAMAEQLLGGPTAAPSGQP